MPLVGGAPARTEYFDDFDVAQETLSLVSYNPCARSALEAIRLTAVRDKELYARIAGGRRHNDR